MLTRRPRPERQLHLKPLSSGYQCFTIACTRLMPRLDMGADQRGSGDVQATSDLTAVRCRGHATCSAPPEGAAGADRCRLRVPGTPRVAQLPQCYPQEVAQGAGYGIRPGQHRQHCSNQSAITAIAIRSNRNQSPGPRGGAPCSELQRESMCDGISTHGRTDRPPAAAGSSLQCQCRRR